MHLRRRQVQTMRVVAVTPQVLIHLVVVTAMVADMVMVMVVVTVMAWRWRWRRLRSQKGTREDAPHSGHGGVGPVHGGHPLLKRFRILQVVLVWPCVAGIIHKLRVQRHDYS